MAIKTGTWCTRMQAKVGSQARCQFGIGGQSVGTHQHGRARILMLLAMTTSAEYGGGVEGCDAIDDDLASFLRGADW